MLIFTEAFEAPIVETIRGQQISFPILEIDDYLPWIGELLAKYKTNATATIDPTLKPHQKKAEQQRIDGFDGGLEMITSLVWTHEGSKRILKMSLSKVEGATPETIEKIIKAVRPNRLHQLAEDVSGLVEKKPDPLPKDKKDPKGQSGEETGPSTDSVSSKPPDAAPAQ